MGTYLCRWILGKETAQKGRHKGLLFISFLMPLEVCFCVIFEIKSDLLLMVWTYAVCIAFPVHLRFPGESRWLRWSHSSCWLWPLLGSTFNLPLHILSNNLCPISNSSWQSPRLPTRTLSHKDVQCQISQSSCTSHGDLVASISVTAISIFMLGHLGKKELGAYNLASMTANITGYAVFQGLVTSFDSLCAQTYGAGRRRELGLYTQRMICLRATLRWR